MGVKEDDLGVWGIPEDDAAIVPEADPVLPCRNSWRTCGGREVVVVLLLLGLGVPGVGVIMDVIDPPPPPPATLLLVLVVHAFGWSNIQPRIESSTSLPRKMLLAHCCCWDDDSSSMLLPPTEPRSRTPLAFAA